MKTIYKYGAPLDGAFTISMPEGARPLHAEIVKNHPELTLTGRAQATCLVWAEVNPEAPLVDREFRLYGTGHPLSEVPQRHINTVLLDGFVWHIYEVMRKDN